MCVHIYKDTLHLGKGRSLCVSLGTPVAGFCLCLQCHCSLLSLCPWPVSFGHMAEHCLPCETAVLTGSDVQGFSGSEVPAHLLCVLVMWQLHHFVLCQGSVKVYCLQECLLAEGLGMVLSSFFSTVPYCSSLFSEKCLSGEVKFETQ